MTIQINNEDLRNTIEEWAKCIEEMATARRSINDIKKGAENKGYDLKAIKQALDIYCKAMVDGTDAAKQELQERNQQQSIADFYIDVLGLGE